MENNKNIVIKLVHIYSRYGTVRTQIIMSDSVRDSSRAENIFLVCVCEGKYRNQIKSEWCKGEFLDSLSCEQYQKKSLRVYISMYILS